MEYAIELTKMIDQELSLCSELLVATRAQRAAIVSGDVLRLAQLVSRAEETIRKIRDIEVSITELASRFAMESGGERCDDPESAIAALAASLEDADQARLADVKSKIAGLLSDIAAANAVNAGLLIDALSYIDNTIKLIAGANGDSSIYSRLGILNRQASSAAVNDTA